MVANEVLRGRFRNGFVTPKPITPNKVEEFVVDLHTQDYAFRKGHRIMVEVQSSWFPLIDRNPQTFVPNIFAGEGQRFQSANAPDLSRRATPRLMCKSPSSMRMRSNAPMIARARCGTVLRRRRSPRNSQTRPTGRRSTSSSHKRSATGGFPRWPSPSSRMIQWCSSRATAFSRTANRRAPTSIRALPSARPRRQ